MATRHAANEIGACSLPLETYSTYYPVALGDIQSLGYLKFQPDLCGHILEIDCGKGSLKIIVTNSNLGGGLDLYASTWAKATGNLPPGQTRCSVQISSQNAFGFSQPKCFHATGETNNAYYHNVGLLNVGSQVVTKAILNGVLGSHRGANPYYSFDIKAAPTDTVTFYFSNGSAFVQTLGNCQDGTNKKYWS